MWQEILYKYNKRFHFNPPIKEDALLNLEEALSTRLPKDLRSFLMETNGIEYPMFFPDELTYYSGMWTIEEIIDRNLSYNEGNCLDTQYLLFAELPNGDMVGYVIDTNGVNEKSIISISHDSAYEPYEIATSLRGFIDIIGELAIEYEPKL